MSLARTLFRALLLFAACCAAHATPYIPTSGSQVLEHLPRRSDPTQQAFARLRAQLARDPGNLATAAQLARLYISASRVDGDPRYLGYAQAVLHPWWNLAQPPEQLLVLRATILQSTHQFPKALADLDKVLRADRGNGQAWLTRATVLTVLGKYDQAKASCERLYPLAPGLITQTCLSNVGSLNGDAPNSYRALSQALEGNPQADTGIRTWILTLLAEMAGRLGDDQAAEAHYREAMALAPPDGYLLGAYADFLLDHGRPTEVIDMLQSKTRNDALLLRYALALKARQSPQAAQQIDSLRQRFAAAAMRGDTVHQREQSRFELHLLNDPKAALATAQRNWQVQKEPADLRVLLEAATAARDDAALTQVRDWIRQTHYEDRALTALLGHAKGNA
jgi:Tfp pilus assembly protein PilF